MARQDGLAQAQRSMLKVGPDKRVPMRAIYEMFKGERQPAEVLKAAEAGTPAAETLKQQRSDAHLYVGLYLDLTGERQRALMHLDRAADEYAIPHYMADVAARAARSAAREALRATPTLRCAQHGA